MDGIATTTSTITTKELTREMSASSAAGVEVADRLAELEREVAQLREALATRQLIGWVAGMLAERYGLGFEEAWGLMVRLSQHTNVKLREVARVIADAYCGAVAADDQPLAEQLQARLGGGLTTAGSGRRRVSV